MLVFNKFAAIFKKLKEIYEKDPRTAQYQILGAEYSKKKTLPCVLVFPESKVWLRDEDTRSFRKASLPKQVAYKFNLWVYVSLTEIEDSYYNEFDGAKAGITQVLCALEAVLREHKTGSSEIDGTDVQLWTDIEYEEINVAQRPGKLMSGKLTVDFITKEIA